MTLFKITVVDDRGDETVFLDAAYQIIEGNLKVVVSGKAAFCWAPGFWAKVSMVAQDG